MLAKKLSAEDRKILQKKLESLGIKSDTLPEEILESLFFYAEKPKISKKSTPEGVGIAETYRVVFSSGYYPQIHIRTNGRSRRGSLRGYSPIFHSRQEVDPKSLLREEKNNLTPSQKTFLEFLVDHNPWQREFFDWVDFFLLLRDSRIPAFTSEYDSFTETPLTFTQDPPKLSLRLFVGDHPQPLYEDPEKTILFDAREVLKNSSLDRNIFLGTDTAVFLKKTSIDIYPLSPTLIELFEAVLNFHALAPWKEKTFICPVPEYILTEIDSLSEEITPFCKMSAIPLSVKKYRQAKPKFLIDFDSQKETLDMRAVINYGSRTVDISRLFRISSRNDDGSFFLRPKSRFSKIPDEDFVCAVSDETVSVAPRKKSLEKSFAQKLLDHPEYGFNRRLGCHRKGNDAIFDFYKKVLPKLQKLGYPLEYTRDELNFSEEAFHADISADANAENDWLSFDAQFSLGSEKISLDDLRAYIQNKDKFLRINGKLLSITNQKELERLIMMLEHFHETEGKLKGKLYHAGEVENIFTSSPHYTAQFSQGLKNFLKESKNGKPVTTVKKTKHIEKTLRDYQKEGVDWLHFLKKYRFAGILADDMGLGKTLQALSMIHIHRIPGKPSVVVCPKTLLYNWEAEAKKFFPDLKVLIIEGAPTERQEKIKTVSSYDLVVTSYPLIHRDKDEYKKQHITFHYCILDESQNIKNHKTKNARFIKEIDADYRLAITGTPLENSVSEIWSVFDFLMPGFLGSFAHFTKRFLTPIMKKNDAEALDDLRKKTAYFMLRRNKSDVLKELPAKIEQYAYCRLGTDQNILYQEVLANVKSTVFKTVKENGFAKSHIHILAGLMKLRQVCNHPALLLKEKKYSLYESAKLDLFLELVDEIVSENKKVLVFSQFTTMLDILSQELEKRSYAHSLLTGKTKNRQALVDDFNRDPAKKIFLISLKAGGTGLNLTSAEHVILFDPWWNPSVENQAIDRAHRIGQTKTVHIQRLITQGTIEEKIVALQQRKQFLFNNVVGESKDLFKHLTWQDIQDLFE